MRRSDAHLKARILIILNILSRYICKSRWLELWRNLRFAKLSCLSPFRILVYLLKYSSKHGLVIVRILIQNLSSSLKSTKRRNTLFLNFPESLFDLAIVLVQINFSKEVFKANQLIFDLAKSVVSQSSQFKYSCFQKLLPLFYLD